MLPKGSGPRDGFLALEETPKLSRKRKRGSNPRVRPIDQEILGDEVRKWKDAKDRTTPDAAKPPPPLNPTQRAFAREHLALCRLLANGRRCGEPPNATLEALVRRNLRQIHLLQGAGGVGKSVLHAAMDRVLRRLGLGGALHLDAASKRVLL